MWDLGAEDPGLLSVNELTRLQRQQPSSHSFCPTILTQLFYSKRSRLAFTCSHVGFIWNISKLYAIYLINLRQKFVQIINFLCWFLKTSYINTSADGRIPTLVGSWSPFRYYGHLLLCWCLTGKALDFTAERKWGGTRRLSFLGTHHHSVSRESAIFRDIFAVAVVLF